MREFRVPTQTHRNGIDLLTVIYLLLSIGVSLLSCLSVSCLQFLGSNLPLDRLTPSLSSTEKAVCFFIMSWSFLEKPLWLREVALHRPEVGGLTGGRERLWSSKTCWREGRLGANIHRMIGTKNRYNAADCHWAKSGLPRYECRCNYG